MRRSVLMNVPSFSRAGLAGKITSAYRQVRRKKCPARRKTRAFECAGDMIRIRSPRSPCLRRRDRSLSACRRCACSTISWLSRPLLRRQLYAPALFVTVRAPSSSHLVVAREILRHRIRYRWCPGRCCGRAADTHPFRPHVVAGDQQQVRDCRRGIRSIAMLRYAHRPQNAGGLRLGISCAIVFSVCDGNPVQLRRKLHRERLETLRDIFPDR